MLDMPWNIAGHSDGPCSKRSQSVTSLFMLQAEPNDDLCKTVVPRYFAFSVGKASTVPPWAGISSIKWNCYCSFVLRRSWVGYGILLSWGLLTAKPLTFETKNDFQKRIRQFSGQWEWFERILYLSIGAAPPVSEGRESILTSSIQEANSHVIPLKFIRSHSNCFQLQNYKGSAGEVAIPAFSNAIGVTW